VIVIDASTVISSALEDEHSVAAGIALEEAADGALVPGNFWSEIVHALARAERRNRITEGSAELFLAELEALPITTEVPGVHATLNAAKKYQLTGYDAAYLALALQTQLPLATIDADLGAAAKAAKCNWRPKG
jgi:predicted nucleic acid-binding protein